MNFARLWEQAKELWSRPVGKWVFGGALLFILTAVGVGYWQSRTNYVTLGTFDADAAVQVSQKLTAAKIPFRPDGDKGFTYMVPDSTYAQAKLLVAELGVDPGGAVWTPELWKNRISWSNTEFDNRRLWVEQTELNLTRTIKALSVVDQARVQISVPMEKPLFKNQENPPKAMVVILPKRGRDLTGTVVESIMQVVAGAVEGMDSRSVVVMDASTSQVVSGELTGKNGQKSAGAFDQFTIMRNFQEHWKKELKEQLEPVVGAGNLTVIVNPVFNWDRVAIEATEYKGAGPNGTGIELSKESNTKTQQGGTGTTGVPAGTTTNTTGGGGAGVPTYTSGTGQSGSASLEEARAISNYLVNQTKTATERPGGAIESLSVGIFVNNQGKVDPELEQAVKNVVTTALGSKAQVEIKGMKFAPSPWDGLKSGSDVTPAPRNLTWLWTGLAVALAAAGVIWFVMAARARPAQPVMIGGPSTQQPSAASVLFDAPHQQRPVGSTESQRVPEKIEDISEMKIEEMINLGEDFLKQMGLDPAKVRLMEKIEQIAKQKPDVIANLVKTWISES